MLTFLKQMLSGDTGPSAKRFWLSVFSSVFIFLVIRDAYTGKHPQELYSNQVFQLVGFCLILVFGEKFIPFLMALRGQKTTTTIVSPETPTVTTVTKEDQPK